MKSDIIRSSRRCRSIYSMLYEWGCDTQNACLAERVIDGIATSHIIC